MENFSLKWYMYLNSQLDLPKKTHLFIKFCIWFKLLEYFFTLKILVVSRNRYHLKTKKTKGVAGVFHTKELLLQQFFKQIESMNHQPDAKLYPLVLPEDKYPNYEEFLD